MTSMAIKMDDNGNKFPKSRCPLVLEKVLKQITQHVIITFLLQTAVLSYPQLIFLNNHHSTYS